MTDAERLQFVSSVLSINDSFRNPYAGIWEHIWWRTDEEYAPVTFFMHCNDLFYWATADLEVITPENFPMIKQSLDDVANALNAHEPTKQDSRDTWQSVYDLWQEVGSYASDLFCARVRKMRPQRPCYVNYPEKIRALFDACGPERDPKDEG